MALRYTAGFETKNEHTGETFDYDIEIYDDTFTGVSRELTLGAMPVQEEKQNDSRSSFPALVPSYLNLELTATSDFDFLELYTDNDRALKVVLKQNGEVWNNYFVIPSNSSESFIDPPYNVSVRCVDGLGLLKNYDYTATGMASVLKVVSNCLNKLGLGLNINTFIRIVYDGLAANQDAFLETQVNQERFIDMNCGEVLTELLKEWVSGLMQINGEWYLFRYPDYVKEGGTTFFARYDSSLTYLGTKDIEPDLLLGNNFGDLIHAKYDAMRSVNMPYKEVSIKYKYGLIKDLMNDDARYFNGASSQTFEEWDKVGGLDATPRGLVNREYAKITGKSPRPVTGPRLALKNYIEVNETLKLKLQITFNAGRANGMPYGIGWRADAQSTPEFLKTDFTWSTDTPSESNDNIHFAGNQYSNPLASYGLGETVKTDIDFEIPGFGEIVIVIYPAYFLASNIYGSDTGELRLYEINLLPSASGRAVISETHTVTNDGNYTTIPNTINVSTGESNEPYYTGTMFKSDGITKTSGFSDDGLLTYKPFLDLAAKDILVQNGRPSGKYEGSVLGNFNMLNIVKIKEWHNPNSIFMPVSLRYDFRNCIVETVLNEVIIDDISYTIQDTVLEYKEPKEAQ